MSDAVLGSSRKETVALAATLIAIGAGMTILGAWVFQFGFGYQPCPLCLEQRIAYYFAIPLAVLVVLGANFGAARKVLVAALAVIALGMVWNAGLGVYHSGVEWHFWAGPSDCSGPVSSFGKAGSLLEQMNSTRVIRCDEAAWRFLGLSLAGYNVLISMALAAIAAWGAWTASRGGESASLRHIGPP